MKSLSINTTNFFSLLLCSICEKNWENLYVFNKLSSYLKNIKMELLNYFNSPSSQKLNIHVG